jgi:transposase, IS30 family
MALAKAPHYAHLTLADREIVRRLRTQKQSPAAIARILGKHRATVCRELRRNGTDNAGIPGTRIYLAPHAHRRMLDRRRAAKATFRHIDRDTMLEAYVEEQLKKGYSPEQVAGVMRRLQHSQRLCHKTIYRWVHRRWQSRKSYLRFRGRPRVRYGEHKRLWQPHRRHISERPRLVEKRLRIGDWEGDLVHGTKDDSRHSLLTLNDRLSGLVVIWKLNTLNPVAVAYHISHALKLLPVKTITFDNGWEFGQHRTIEKLIRCKVYFTDTHSPQQRGSNENLNGLIREYFPKGMSLAHVTQADATRVATILNGRPRKRLGYDTPRNVFARLTGMGHHVVR